MTSKRTRQSFNRFSEKHLLQVAVEICNCSPGNILLIGGGAVLPEITGFKRLRPRSNDLDFIVNSAGKVSLDSSYDLDNSDSLLLFGDPSIKFIYIREVLIGLFIKHLRGYQLQEQDYKDALVINTNQGNIHTIRPELNLALKIRRGAVNNHVYAKDGLDLASIIAGMQKKGEKFDLERFSRYMQRGVCEDCQLGSNQKCFDQLQSGEHNLKAEYRLNFYETLNRCRKEARLYCKHPQL